MKEGNNFIAAAPVLIIFLLSSTREFIYKFPLGELYFFFFFFSFRVIIEREIGKIDPIELSRIRERIEMIHNEYFRLD